jgi:hypothetical protein
MENTFLLLWIIRKYFIKDKKYTQNPKESSNCPEATVGLNQRSVICPQDSLRTGGLGKTGDAPPSR